MSDYGHDEAMPLPEIDDAWNIIGELVNATNDRRVYLALVQVRGTHAELRADRDKWERVALVLDSSLRAESEPPKGFDTWLAWAEKEAEDTRIYDAQYDEAEREAEGE